MPHTATNEETEYTTETTAITQYMNQAVDNQSFSDNE